MAYVLLAVVATSPGPVVEPPADDAQRQRTKHRWIGWDGSVWDLTDPSGGAYFTDDPIVGAGDGPADRFKSESPAVAGSRYRGNRALERPITWPVALVADSSLEWLDVRAAFWRTMDTDRPGTWEVELPGGRIYRLPCRYLGGGDPGYADDPLADARAEYTIQMVADDPYWLGAPVVRTFVQDAALDFFDPTGDPTMFYISEGSTLSTATMANPGDVDGWPVWTVAGATTATSLGVDGHTVGLTQVMDSTDVAVVDTDPRAQSAHVNGVRVRGVLTPHDFAPIPPGAEVPLTLTMTGSGTVTCTIVPRVKRVL